MSMPSLPPDGDNSWGAADWAAEVHNRVQGNGAASTPTVRTLGTGSSEASAGNHTHTGTPASETVSGPVELATAAETTTGTDNTRAVHPAGLKVELDKKANRLLTINTVSATTYTLVLTDGNDVLINCTAATAVTVTFPQDSAVAIAVGASGIVRQAGAGQVTTAQGTGATLQARGSALKTAGQFASLTWTKVAANTFDIAGDATT